MRATGPRRHAGLARFGVVLLLAGSLLGVPAATAADPVPGLSVSGNLLLRDGEPFLPRGFNMIGLLTPAWCDRAVGIAARDHFGPEELAAAASWSADTLRFQVSQRGLADPDVPEVDRAAYLASVVERVAVARAAGFVVIVSMQDQFYGCGDVHPLPSAATVDAWSALVPELMADPDVAFELFNEPRNEADAAGWAQWRTAGAAPTRTSATSPSATRPSSTTCAGWARPTCSSPTRRGWASAPRACRASTIRWTGSPTASTRTTTSAARPGGTSTTATRRPRSR